METKRNILIAFVLNLAFSLFECVGGLITGSVAIISDSIHDLGDAISIGISYLLESKSKKAPDEIYTYGYSRYSVIGSVITTLVLVVGSVIIIYNAVLRIINPIKISYDGMIVFAIFGVVINYIAAYFTRGGESLNQKAVNLHMLEDVLGWVVVLIGAIVMRFTNISIIDPIMSIAVAVFILINALHSLKCVFDLFLEKTPENISVHEIREHLMGIDGVEDVHHIHIRSIDGFNNASTMHIVTDRDAFTVKELVREELSEHGIHHATIEIETKDEVCNHKHCHFDTHACHGHHHHHH